MNLINETPETLSQLKQQTKSTPKFSLKDQVKICKVVDIYDGDTCRVVFKHGDAFNKWTIRMNGYDTPEMRPSKSLPNRDEIKKNAIASRDYLKSLIMNEPEQLVYLHCGDFDKYGRLLGDIYVNDPTAPSTPSEENPSVNSLMVKNNYGYVYHGGAKKK